MHPMHIRNAGPAVTHAPDAYTQCRPGSSLEARDRCDSPALPASLAQAEGRRRPRSSSTALVPAPVGCRPRTSNGLVSAIVPWGAEGVEVGVLEGGGTCEEDGEENNAPGGSEQAWEDEQLLDRHQGEDEGDDGETAGEEGRVAAGCEGQGAGGDGSWGGVEHTAEAHDEKTGSADARPSYRPRSGAAETRLRQRTGLGRRTDTFVISNEALEYTQARNVLGLPKYFRWTLPQQSPLARPGGGDGRDSGGGGGMQVRPVGRDRLVPGGMAADGRSPIFAIRQSPLPAGVSVADARGTEVSGGESPVLGGTAGREMGGEAEEERVGRGAVQGQGKRNRLRGDPWANAWHGGGGILHWPRAPQRPDQRENEREGAALTLSRSRERESESEGERERERERERQAELDRQQKAGRIFQQLGAFTAPGSPSMALIRPRTQRGVHARDMVAGEMSDDIRAAGAQGADEDRREERKEQAAVGEEKGGGREGDKMTAGAVRPGTSHGVEGRLGGVGALGLGNGSNGRGARGVGAHAAKAAELSGRLSLRVMPPLPQSLESF